MAYVTSKPVERHSARYYEHGNVMYAGRELLLASSSSSSSYIAIRKRAHRFLSSIFIESKILIHFSCYISRIFINFRKHSNRSFISFVSLQLFTSHSQNNFNRIISFINKTLLYSLRNVSVFSREPSLLRKRKKKRINYVA